MSTLEPATDKLIVQRGSDLYTTTIDAMSTIQNNDLIMIGRGSDTYKITGQEFIEQTGGGDVPDEPVINSVSLQGSGAGFSDETFTTIVDGTAGNPVASYELKARVQGSLQIVAQTDTIIQVDEAAPSQFIKTFDDGNITVQGTGSYGSNADILLAKNTGQWFFRHKTPPPGNSTTNWYVTDGKVAFSPTHSNMQTTSNNVGWRNNNDGANTLSAWGTWAIENDVDAGGAVLTANGIDATSAQRYWDFCIDTDNQKVWISVDDRQSWVGGGNPEDPENTAGTFKFLFSNNNIVIFRSCAYSSDQVNSLDQDEPSSVFYNTPALRSAEQPAFNYRSEENLQYLDTYGTNSGIKRYTASNAYSYGTTQLSVPTSSNQGVYFYKIFETRQSSYCGWFLGDVQSGYKNTVPNQLDNQNSIGQRTNEDSLGAWGTYASANNKSPGASALSGFGQTGMTNTNTEYVIDFAFYCSNENLLVWVKKADNSIWVGGGDPNNPNSTPSFKLPKTGDVYFGFMTYIADEQVSIQAQGAAPSGGTLVSFASNTGFNNFERSDVVEMSSDSTVTGVIDQILPDNIPPKMVLKDVEGIWLVNNTVVGSIATPASSAFIEFDSGTGEAKSLSITDPGFKPAPPGFAIEFIDPATGLTWDQELPAGTSIETKVFAINTVSSVESNWTSAVTPRALSANMTAEELENAHVEAALLLATFKNRQQVYCGNTAEQQRDDLIAKLAAEGYSLTKVLSYL